MTEQNKNISKAPKNTSVTNYPNDTKYSLSNPEILKTYIKEIQQHQSELMSSKTTLKRKQEIIQAAIDRATTSAGLPKVKIQFSSNSQLKSGGEYDRTKNIGYLGTDLTTDEDKKRGLARIAGLAYHEARHMEQSYRALQYDMVENGKNSKFAINQELSSELTAAASKSSLPEGRYQYSKNMRDELEKRRTIVGYDSKANYPNHNIEKDTYVINRKVYNLLYKDNRGSNGYRYWFKKGDDAAQKGIKEDKINEYKGIESLSVKSLQSSVPSIMPDSTNTSQNAFVDSSAQNTSNDQKNNASDLSKVVALLQNNAAAVQSQYGLDVTTHEGLGKAVMQYWQENNLDPKTLKEQLPQMREAELETASSLLAKKSTATAKTEQLVK
jgi:hypothetical protein